VTIAVSRLEIVDPPPPVILANGSRDLVPQSNYFQERVPDYRHAAARVLNNLLLFFKYTLRQPLLALVRDSDQDFQNPDWTDDNGKPAGRMGGVFVVSAIHGLHSELGSTKLEKKHDTALTAALAKPQAVALHEEILSDAQAAAFVGDIRRAVLEMAIACEVFTKHVFFETGSRASQVLEALEDKGEIHINVLKLLDVGASAVLGVSFRKFDLAAFHDIDNLFRARNKVAHRGEVIFRDEKGKLHTVDRKILQNWWSSLEKLFAWAQ
jgi:hypothetical protein